MLKKFVGKPPASPPALPVIHHGAVVPEPLRVERARLARGVRQVLVHWRGEPAESTSWEDLDDFRAAYTDFQLADELDLEGGEMSCTVAHIQGAGALATCAGRLNARNMRAASHLLVAS